MKKFPMSLAITIALLLSIGLPARPAIAGPYAEDLAKCMVAKTSKSDKDLFVKWIFVSLAADPALASISSVTYSQRLQISKKLAAMVQNLLLVSCGEKAKQAVKYEGPTSLVYAFKVLGQAASFELYSNPEVKKALRGSFKYMDQKKIDSVLGIDQSNQ